MTTEPELAGSCPDPSLLLSKDEGRRCQALEMAINAHADVEHELDADLIVKTAKTFETYLKG